MKHFKYKDRRDKIRSGDLLIWSNGQPEPITNFITTIIRLFTSSEYSHVGVAWKIKGRLFVVEATVPVVRIVPVSDKEEFYRVPVGLEWSDDRVRDLIEHVGKSYSIADALRAWKGITNDKDNGKWQCGELVHNFYLKAGVDLGDAFTPSRVVYSMVKNTGAFIEHISKR